MSQDRDQPTSAAIDEEDLSVDFIRRCLAGTPELRRSLAVWLLGVVDREIRITLRPIAVRYRRDLRDVAEDLVQDVLVVLLHQDGQVLRTWDPARGMKLRSFVALVVRRYVHRRFRGFRGNPWSSDPAAAEDLASLLEDGITPGASLLADIEYRLQLDEILEVLRGELNERDWRLFTKLFVEQRSPADVGGEEEMSENSVHKWSSRFHQRVRRLFAPSAGKQQSVVRLVAG